jgi:glycerol kinase
VILAIDQGATGTTCIVFDAGGRPAGRAYREFTQHFPRPLDVAPGGPLQAVDRPTSASRCWPDGMARSR